VALASGCESLFRNPALRHLETQRHRRHCADNLKLFEPRSHQTLYRPRQYVIMENILIVRWRTNGRNQPRCAALEETVTLRRATDAARNGPVHKA
jgi:hypothetical protein